MDAACHREESRTGSGLQTRHRRDRPHCRRLTAHRELALPPRARRSLPPAYDPATRPVDWAPREASPAVGRGADAHVARTGIPKGRPTPARRTCRAGAAARIRRRRCSRPSAHRPGRSACPPPSARLDAPAAPEFACHGHPAGYPWGPVARPFLGPVPPVPQARRNHERLPAVRRLPVQKGGATQAGVGSGRPPRRAIRGCHSVVTPRLAARRDRRGPRRWSNMLSPCPPPVALQEPAQPLLADHVIRMPGRAFRGRRPARRGVAERRWVRVSWAVGDVRRPRSALARSGGLFTRVSQVRSYGKNDSLVYTPRECAIPKGVSIGCPNDTRNTRAATAGTAAGACTRPTPWTSSRTCC